MALDVLNGGCYSHAPPNATRIVDPARMTNGHSNRSFRQKRLIRVVPVFFLACLLSCWPSCAVEAQTPTHPAVWHDNPLELNEQKFNERELASVDLFPPSTSRVVAGTGSSKSSLDDLGSNEREVMLSTALLTLLCTVVLSLFASHTCKCYHIEWLPLPLIAIVFGFMVGIIVRFAVLQHSIVLDQILAFNDDVFFIALLPPIIFERSELSGQFRSILYCI